ncbi:LON peptidase substrate-binding domain-containing protein [Albirhodobacter sp. R86504]|jgi:Lon protease-like protein|uniref:LON peptidase substrate-binding domain-containing protein n=1 Tax=Albirhodobacter sp. R86504 TaxID=3093848 RepID=UPI003670D37E
MIKANSLPETLSLFPLTGAVLLPRGRLPLHIFEPRYLQMIEDCLKTRERLIGMVQPAGGRLATIGCAGRLTGFTETEDGRYMITLSGISRFRIRREIEGFTPYRRAEVAWTDFARDLGPAEHDETLDRKQLYRTLRSYLESQGLGPDWDSLKEAEDELLINSLSMLLPFDAADKQALLEAPSLSTRRETLITLMEYALHGGGEESLQ